jgi:hypothetical protein
MGAVGSEIRQESLKVDGVRLKGDNVGPEAPQKE